jgi:GAF domain-containing protein
MDLAVLGELLGSVDSPMAGLDRVLAAALALSAAERGNVQIREPTGELRIAAQRGFSRDFLDHFAVVDNDGSACGRAAEKAAQTVIIDVTKDPAFEPHRSIAAASGFRAVVSTPLISDSGLGGVVSAHFPRPHRPSAHELRSLRQLGQIAGTALSRFPVGELSALATADGNLGERNDPLASQALWSPTLEGFRRVTVDGRDGSDFFALTREVTDAFGLAGAGVSLTEGEAMRTVAAQSERAAALELIQQQYAVGPCVESQRTARPVLVADLTDHPRKWKEFTTVAATVGVVSVAAIPIRLGGAGLGVLDLYHDSQHRWTTEEVRLADRLARMAASYAFELYRARRTTIQLQQALDSRVIIEQAKGMLAERMGITIDAAFGRIRAHSRNHHTPLRTVADAVVQQGLNPGEDQNREG